MTRVGMFTYSTQPRGSVVHAACLSEALTQRGHDVTLVALSKNGDRFFRDVACRVCLLPAAPAPAQLEALIAQRISEVARGLGALGHEFDVLHAQDCLVASGLLEARRQQPALGACPLVRTVHHVEHFESPFLAECQRRSVLEANVVLSVSRATAEDVSRTFERPSARVDNGVDRIRFAALPRLARAALRRSLGYSPKARIVLSVGGVEPRKNSLSSLAAMARVCRERPDALWLIAGGASVLDHRAYREAFDAELAALPSGVRHRIVRTGTLAERELIELYQISDVLLAASEHEGFGLSVLEGMAAAVPVVVSRRPPFTEYVPEDAALFVDPQSPAEIAGAVLRLLQSTALATRRGRRGARVAGAYSWDRSAEQHARVYAHALAERPHA